MEGNFSENIGLRNVSPIRILESFPGQRHLFRISAVCCPAPYPVFGVSGFLRAQKGSFVPRPHRKVLRCGCRAGVSGGRPRPRQKAGRRGDRERWRFDLESKAAFGGKLC